MFVHQVQNAEFMTSLLSHTSYQYFVCIHVERIICTTSFPLLFASNLNIWVSTSKLFWDSCIVAVSGVALLCFGGRGEVSAATRLARKTIYTYLCGDAGFRVYFTGIYY